jgi:flagellar biosynthesis protein FlhB
VEEKSVKPSAKKLKKAKEEGIVPFSYELAHAMALLGSFVLLGLSAHLFKDRLNRSFFALYTYTQLLDPEEALVFSLKPLALPLILVLMGIFLLTFCSHFFQTGWIWKWKAKRSRGRESFFPLSFFKLAIAAALLFFGIKTIGVSTIPIFSSSRVQFYFLLKKIFFLLILTCGVFVLLGLLDFFYQNWRHYKKMHMTRREAEDEKREEEGDHQTKKRMKQR